MFMHIYLHVCVFASTCIFTYTYIYVCTYTYIYIYVCSNIQVFISHSSKGHDASEKLCAALLHLAPSLEIFTSHTHRNDSTHIPKTRVFLPLLDSAYHRSQRCSNEFADACAQVCMV